MRVGAGRRELGMTADVALHLDAGDAEVTRRLLARAALEAMRPLLDDGPGQARHPSDLAALGEAFGAARPSG